MDSMASDTMRYYTTGLGTNGAPSVGLIMLAAAAVVSVPVAAVGGAVGVVGQAAAVSLVAAAGASQVLANKEE